MLHGLVVGFCEDLIYQDKLWIKLKKGSDTFKCRMADLMSCLANVPLWAKTIPAFIRVQSLENEPYTIYLQ